MGEKVFYTINFGFTANEYPDSYGEDMKKVFQGILKKMEDSGVIRYNYAIT